MHSWRRLATNLRVFLTGPFSRACSTTSPTAQVGRCKMNVWLKAKEVAILAARFRAGYWCFFGSGSDTTCKRNECRPSYQSADGGWDYLALRMEKELTIGKHRVSEHSSIKCFDEVKDRRRSWNAFENRVRKSSHARENGFGVQSTPSVCVRSKIESRRNCSVSSPQTTSLCSV